VVYKCKNIKQNIKQTRSIYTSILSPVVHSSGHAFATYRLLLCIQTVAMLVIWVRVIVGLIKLKNTAVPEK